MNGKRFLVVAAVGIVLVLAALSLSNWLGGRDALRDAELDALRKDDVALVRLAVQRAAQRDRQLQAARASADSSQRLYERSEALRRRMVLVPRTTVVQRSDSGNEVESHLNPTSDTIGVDPRVLERIAADSATIEGQVRTIARLELVVRTDSSLIADQTALLQNRQRQIRVLESKVPSRFWRTVERVALVSGGLYVGYRVGTGR